MNGDEIVFGEMKVREPERLPRPDRDRKYACLAYEVPAPIDLPIFLDRRTADAIERHALSDTSVELGGILLGKECVDPATGQPFVWVTQSLEAKHYANTQASFTYTHDSWEEITRERDRLHPEFDIVGWYHTHPSFGITHWSEKKEYAKAIAEHSEAIRLDPQFANAYCGRGFAWQEQSGE